MASGIPSSRATSRPTVAAVVSSSPNPGCTHRARSANSVTASQSRAAARSSGSGSASGPSRYRTSPAIRSGSRLVASTRTSSAPSSSLPHSSAAAPITCSQLSSTSSSCRRARARASASAGATGGRSRIPSAAATTAATCAGSRTAASSASHTPSANRPAACRATSPASRVFPAPPGPVTVTRRCWPSWPATSSTVWARPTKLVSVTGKPWVLPVTPAAADRSTAVTLTTVGVAVQPRRADGRQPGPEPKRRRRYQEK